MKIQEIHFLDIETVPNKSLQDFTGTDAYHLFKKKFQHEIEELPSVLGTDAFLNELYNHKASLHSEFGKIVCVSIGKMQATKFYVKTIINKNEKDLLIELAEILKSSVFVCAHNGKEFDFPFLFRRYIINGLPIPAILNTIGKKPWDIPHLDTMEMWGSTQWKYRTSLDLLANLFGLPSPKKDMVGSDVAKVWYDMFDVPNDQLPFEKEEAAFKKISQYCAGDIVTMAQVFCKMKGLDLIPDDLIVHV